jgi:hypothetical protein
MQGTLVFLSPVSCCSSNQTTSESGWFRTVSKLFFKIVWTLEGELRSQELQELQNGMDRGFSPRRLGRILTFAVDFQKYANVLLPKGFIF